MEPGMQTGDGYPSPVACSQQPSSRALDHAIVRGHGSLATHGDLARLGAGRNARVLSGQAVARRVTRARGRRVAAREGEVVPGAGERSRVTIGSLIREIRFLRGHVVPNVGLDRGQLGL